MPSLVPLRISLSDWGGVLYCTNHHVLYAVLVVLLHCMNDGMVWITEPLHPLVQCKCPSSVVHPCTLYMTRTLFLVSRDSWVVQKTSNTSLLSAWLSASHVEDRQTPTTQPTRSASGSHPTNNYDSAWPSVTVKGPYFPSRDEAFQIVEGAQTSIVPGWDQLLEWGLPRHTNTVIWAYICSCGYCIF